MNLFNSFFGALGIIFTISVIAVSIIIFLENRDPSKTIAWLLVLILFPIIGFVIYLLFGQNIRKKKIFKTQKLLNEIESSNAFKSIKEFENLVSVQKSAITDNLIFDDENSFTKKRIMNLLLNTGRSPFTLNNEIKILTNGQNKFTELINDLKSAKDHIHMEYYIIKDSQIGRQIKDVLIQKAKEGVEIRILYDDVGSWRLWFNKNFFNEMRKEGINIYPFLPSLFPFLNKKINYRNHRKIVVIDGKIGYIGGINIGDEYLGKDKKIGFWRDTHIKIQGEAVYMMQLTFLFDWYFSSRKLLLDKKYFPKLSFCGENIVQVVSSGPDSDWEAIHKAYFTAICQAKKRIYIQTPYFIPDESILMALKTAALSGVDVKIMFPANPDHKVVYWASLSYFSEILKAGGKVYLYENGFLHCKTLIIDDDISSVGTANMDLRSFMLNFEINAFIYDRQVTSELLRDFNEDIKECREITLNEYMNRPITQKIKESSSRLLSPIL
ncbi:cardiolipin synthase [Alkalithermobacter thermoalcaliphilus JW-YL-7 = DSM 7308]|uniref:Cardiolipin synthase n=1 Tax=Alkalithermobacter thermoalcaliphilus JW-YL-7 = DSM 7308 TaxID=1121328 RepID=A0A150FNA3_CLOPD|nr:Cardiolipin synthase [[Clostridium] paradoxum JW-YL-7 = DSM 7308]SHK90330.1 cardiolipin synthase [[Clostridium] paradoxum JW-YL-7 = DSM 7308]